MRKLFHSKYFFSIVLLIQYFHLHSQNKKNIDSLENIVNSAHNDTIKVNRLINLSRQYQDDNPATAFEFGLRALAISTESNDQNTIGKAHNNLGDLYWYYADYESSSDHYFKALKVYENLKDKAAIAECYRNIGWTYHDQQNYSEALIYYNKSLAINSELNRTKAIGQNYDDIGIIYHIQKKYDKAIIYYNSALEKIEKLNDKRGLAAIYDDISKSYNEIGDMDLAIENGKKSLKFSEEIGNKHNASNEYNNLASFYIKVQKYDDATDALKKGLELAKKIDNKNSINQIYINFSTLHSQQDDFQKALEYTHLSLRIKDSIYDENNERQKKEMMVRYELKKKKLAIDNLQKEKALSEEKLNSEKQSRIYLLLFCAMIAAIAFVLLQTNNRRKKINLHLLSAYHEIEEKNKDITDSINYSKRIQNITLPSAELRNKLFNDIFILFKPKDIVSGDFYWYTEKNEKKIIAACDCTGHGVPGALMSMLGNNILNQIVNEKGITSPDEILNQLHKEIRKALKQEEQAGSKDGMDIALVTFNNETEIEYAGANRPLWIIKKIDSEAPQSSSINNKQIIEIKPDKYSIGGLQNEGERTFVKHKILLSKNDCIYIFSDGYTDQFGGDHGKKFMTKQFKELLLTNFNNTMFTQEKNLDEVFEIWKGEYEQVDDILVIGIRT